MSRLIISIEASKTEEFVNLLNEFGYYGIRVEEEDDERSVIFLESDDNDYLIMVTTEINERIERKRSN